MNNNNTKIFVIGFNKTGTTSIHNLFKTVDINSYHGTRRILNLLQKYDAFCDGEHFNFEDYHEKQPNSLFILNTRPIKSWLISRYKHAQFHKFNTCWCWPITEERTYSWIERYEDHFNNIFKFFTDKAEQLYIVNIEKPGWESDMLNFLKKDNLNLNVHLNKRDNNTIDKSTIDAIDKNVSKCLQHKGYIGNELVPLNIDISQYSYQNYM